MKIVLALNILDFISCHANQEANLETIPILESVSKDSITRE